MKRRRCDQCEALFASDSCRLSEEVTVIRKETGFTAIAEFLVIDDTNDGVTHSPLDLCTTCLRLILVESVASQSKWPQ